MKHLLTILLLLPTLVCAQIIPIRVDMAGYRGNAIESRPITLLPTDTLQSITVRATYSSAVNSQTVIHQPTVYREGLLATVRFDPSLSLPTEFWYELKIGGIVRFFGTVYVNKAGLILTNQDGSLLSAINSKLAILTSGLSSLSAAAAGSAVSLSAVQTAFSSFVTSYTANRTTDQAATTAAQSTANTALTTANSATTTGATHTSQISTLQSGKLDLSVYTTNRATDQAATTNAQNTANSAVATGASNGTAISSHASNTSNPHNVTKAQIGLGSVDNTSDANKPISTAQQTALNGKQNTLVSGTTIKTVNGTPLLGNGDLVISPGTYIADTSAIIAARTQTLATISYLTQFARNKTIRVLYGGTSIANNTNAGTRQFFGGLIAALGNSGNTTQHLGSLGGSYTAAYFNWKKQSYGGFGFVRVRGDSTSTPISFSAYMSRYVLRYSKEVAGGSFTVSVDGVVSATISCSGTQLYANEWTYNFSSPGQHTITINPPTTGFVYLETQDFLLNNPGIHLMDASLGGSAINQTFVVPTAQAGMAPTIQATGLNGINSLYNNTNTYFKPDIAVFTWVVNDAGGGLSNYNTYYKPAIDSVVASCQKNNVQLVLIIEPGGHYSLPSDPQYATYNTIRAQMLSYRNRYGVTVLDWQAKLGLNTTNLATLKRLSERYYSITNLNASTGTYDNGGDFIHPNDLANSQLAEMLYAATGITPTGRQGNVMQVAVDQARSHLAAVSATPPAMYAESYVGLSGFTKSDVNGLGITMTYRNIGSSVNMLTGRSEPIWYAGEEGNYVNTLNDAIATSGLSDNWGKYKIYTSGSPFQGNIALPNATSATSKYTFTLLVGPGQTSISIKNPGSTAFLPLSIQGTSFIYDNQVSFTNSLSEPQFVHITIDTYGVVNPYIVVFGQLYALYVTSTGYAVLPGLRHDQSKLLIPSVGMVGDVAASKVTINQSYYETVNGKTFEKIAIGKNIFKPLDTSGNKWFGLYRLRNTSSADNQLMTVGGTITTGAYSEQFGGVTYTTTANPVIFSPPNSYTTTAIAGKTYTVTGNVFTGGLGIQIFGNGQYLSLQANGTWVNVGGTATNFPNLLANTGNYFSRPVAVTFTFPDTSVLTSGTYSVFVKVDSGWPLIGYWHLCEGSSATN